MSAPLPVAVAGGTAGVAANLDDIAQLGARFAHAAGELHAEHQELTRVLQGPTAQGRGLFDDADAFDLAVAHPLLAVTVARALDRLAAAHWLTCDVAGGLRSTVAAYHHTESRVLAGLRAVTTTVAPLSRVGAHATVDAGHELWHDWLAGRDGQAIAHPTGTDASRVATTPPRTLVDLVAALAHRNDGPDGSIDIRILTLPDGTRRVVVDLPGTDTMTSIGDRRVRDLGGDLRAIDGDTSAYEQGVLAAMRKAGVGAGDDVMIVGHSLGGMVAVNIARRTDITGEFRVTHVVTAGSPVGRTVGRTPRETQVLSIEDRDVVPRLDHAANPDRRNVTTVHTERARTDPRLDIGGRHSLRATYLPAAGDVQASRNRSVRDFLAGARGYFGATSVTVRTYSIERG